jgi:acyl-CoA synthetase (AMP-forming)/AMP-acid ligase II
VLYTHRQLAAMRDTVAETFGIRPGARLVAGFAPFALLGPALGAVSVTPAMDVTAPRTLTASALADAAAAIDATVVFASPAALRNVLATREGLSAAGHKALGSIGLLLSAGAPVPEPLLAEVQRLLPRASLHTPYGMTEALPVTDISLEQIQAADADAAAGTVAGAGNGVCVGSRCTVPAWPWSLAADGTAPGGDPVTEAGVTGEILVSAPHVKEAYDRLWLIQQESASLPGWHRTGDVGHFDAAGRLWVEGRLAHVVTAPNSVVTPVGAEQAIERLDGVRLAAITGVGPAGTQAVVAVVETLPPARKAGPAAPQLAGDVRRAALGGRRQCLRRARSPRPAHGHPAQRQDRQEPPVPLGLAGAGRWPARNAMRVLVTGASGLLGGEVARLLVRQGHDVATFQRRPSGVDGATDFCGSVSDEEALRAAVEGAQGIIHLAAKVSFTGRAAEFDEVNVEGTRRLLRCARAAGVRDVVFVSSPSVANSGAAIAGMGAEPADPEHAHGDYSRTKAEAELLALAADAPEFRVAAVRPTLSGVPVTPSWSNGSWHGPAGAACRCSTPVRPSSTPPTWTTPPRPSSPRCTAWTTSMAGPWW